ncbi:AAA family ATPase [Bacteroides mediterraneensis]|uniref:AAA family ATPase n=1 Tax=Bacteroides mediterraneensis TaxID=1841856 RepID=UPI0026EEEE5C|nr:AAA family ATPase [Bacteroides mediterraneensis]
MQFKYIHIKNLFGLYNYNIDFFHEDENKLTILTAPNGYGKTTVLTILDSLSPESLYYFYLLKYETIEIGLSDGTCLLINQSFSEKEEQDKDKTSDTKQASVKEVRFSWLNKDSSVLCYFLYNDNVIKKARRNLGFRHGILFDSLGQDNVQTDKDLLKNKRFNEYIAHGIGQDIFLMQLESLRTKFIHANRIYNEANKKNDVLPIQKIRLKLQNYLSWAYQNYLQQSQRIDSQFIKRVISKEKETISEEVYNQLAQKVILKRDELFYFRLTDNIAIPAYDKDDSFILYNYIKGLGEKYANYGNLVEKLNLFNKLLQTKKFAQKSITFSPQHGFQIISANGDMLDESLLSSGEQNEIILLFLLIFEVSDNSVLLIDEPENSLHVVWQQKFLDDIQEIAKIKNLQVIVSTHSISIVSRGQDNTIDLYYLQKQ